MLMASSAFAQVVSTQLWNNTSIYNGAVSPVVAISSAEPTYTVYFKPVSVAAQDYYVNLQTSPDGVTWSTVPDKSIYVSKYAAANTVYQLTAQVKTVRLRLFVTPTNVSFSASASAWMVN